MVEANLNGQETKNRLNCIDIEAIIKVVLEEQRNKVKVSRRKGADISRLESESKSLKKLLDKSKYNNKYMNELKDIKYIKSRVGKLVLAPINK